MEYEPQTMSEREMEKRLQLFEKEFRILTESMDIISTKTGVILQALDIRLNEALKRTEEYNQLKRSDT
ncbi:MAG TPA: hypothetical protein VGE31_00510 [Candidatus Paceibacterota bacterium]